MSNALKKSIVDAIEEGQLKLGYREETIRLYYPLSSLCTLIDQIPGLLQPNGEDQRQPAERRAQRNPRF